MRVLKYGLHGVRALCPLMILLAFSTGAHAQTWIRSWNPPPKEYTVMPVDIPSDGSLPVAFGWPNLCHTYYLWQGGEARSINLWPFGSLTPGSEVGLKKARDLLEEKRATLDFDQIAAIDGYGANYLDVRRGDILPLLGHLFHVARGTELHRLEPAQTVYKKLGFALEGTYSFPYHGAVVQKWYDRIPIESRRRGELPSERYPNYAYNIFRGNKIIVRNIKRQLDDGTSAVEVELAVVPLVIRGRAVGLWPKEEDFHWYSVGDELLVAWPILVRRGGIYTEARPVETTPTDLRYYKITNIVLPDSPTIQVQPEDGGEPIECKPIGWVDIDIHGREEPEKKAGSP